jgi:hypothetical protein
VAMAEAATCIATVNHSAGMAPGSPDRPLVARPPDLDVCYDLML